MPKLDLTADAEYVANLVNVNIWGCKRATVYFVTLACYTRITTFLSAQCIISVGQWTDNTRRQAPSTDRTARRQFPATGQLVSRTQASDAMTSRLPRYEAKCVQRRCFQWDSVPLRSDIKGPLPIY